MARRPNNYPKQVTFTRTLPVTLQAAHLEEGMVTPHHKTGKLVLVTGGYYLDPQYGRLSNFFHWREIKPNGTLGRASSGYGWSPTKIQLRNEGKIK